MLKTKTLVAGLLAGLALSFSTALAGENCLEQGDRLGAFTVSKVAGTEDDGVEVGTSLCYRCKFQSRPMVLVFSRTDSESLGKFVQALDETVKKHEDQQLRGLVSMLGDDQQEVTEAAKKFAATFDVKNMPVTVPEDHKMGPKNYKIDEEADVVVVVATEGEVVKTFSFASDEIDGEPVMETVSKILKS